MLEIDIEKNPQELAGQPSLKDLAIKVVFGLIVLKLLGL